MADSPIPFAGSASPPSELSIEESQWVVSPTFTGWQTTWTEPIATTPTGPAKQFSVLAGATWIKPDAIGVKAGRIRLAYTSDQSGATRIRYVGSFGTWLSTGGESFGPFNVAIT